MRYTITVLALASVTLAGCGATLSSAASRVQVHTQISTALNSCKKLGPVMATYTMRPFVDSDPYLIAALREETTKLGGDSVALLQREDVGMDAVRHGVAYRCF